MKRNNLHTALDCPLPKQVIYHPSAFDRASGKNERFSRVAARGCLAISWVWCFFLLVIPLLADSWFKGFGQQLSIFYFLFGLVIHATRALIIMKQLQIKFALPEIRTIEVFDIIVLDGAALCYAYKLLSNTCSVAIAQNQSD